MRLQTWFFPAWVGLVGIGELFLVSHFLEGTTELVVKWALFAVVAAVGACIEQRLKRRQASTTE